VIVALLVCACALFMYTKFKRILIRFKLFLKVELTLMTAHSKALAENFPGEEGANGKKTKN